MKYVVWSGIVLMGEFEADNAQEAIEKCVCECGGHEFDYEAMCVEEQVDS